MGFKSPDRNQTDLFGYSLNDFVPKDAKCRFVVDIVSKLDLTELYQRYSSQGNDAFDPAMMLSAWFYAYSNAVTTTRKLEERCQRDLHYMFVSGSLKPDHTSLSRFRKNHLDLIPDYFLQIIRIAVEQGISDFKLISIDGSKIQAASSIKHSKTSDELSQYLDNVRKDIQDYMRHCDLLEENSADESSLDEIRSKIDDLKKLEKTLLERQEELETRKRSLKAEHRRNHKINTAEPDARNMNKVNGRQKLPAYNVQLSVDARTQLITANQTVTDSNDYDQLTAQHKNVESNLGADSRRCYVYDAGYHNLEHLEYINLNQVNAYVASPRKESDQQAAEFDRRNFIYDSENDHYTCPAGNNLTYEKDYTKENKWSGRIYKTNACPDCVLKSQCLAQNTKSKYRRIQREHREIYAEQMHRKGRTEHGRFLQYIRSTTVEPVFGNLKANLGFRRFSLKGHGRASGEFNLMCIAHNLNKLFRLMGSLKQDEKISIDYLKTLCQRTVLHLFEKMYLIINPFLRVRII